jgi:hypothetical protein
MIGYRWDTLTAESLKGFAKPLQRISILEFQNRPSGT